LDALAVGITRKKVNYVFDADLRDFFSRLDQSWLERLLEQRRADKRVLRHYYAVPDNGEALAAFRYKVVWYWWRALRRRSQRSRTSWERMRRLAARWIPTPRIHHPWPSLRFDARTQGRSPVR
jgi:hypothetical protein